MHRFTSTEQHYPQSAEFASNEIVRKGSKAAKPGQRHHGPAAGH
jgi:hypothetical protein